MINKIELLKIKDAVREYPPLSASTIYYWIKCEKMPHVRLNGRIFLEKDRLDKWIDQNRIEPRQST
jgi:hypothetical protein